MKKPLKLPTFKNEDEERDFWANVNLADYFEPSDAQKLNFSNLSEDPFKNLKLDPYEQEIEDSLPNVELKQSQEVADKFAQYATNTLRKKTTQL